MRTFYNGVLGLPVALDQGQCLIFRVGTTQALGYFGFCADLQPELTRLAKVFLTLVVATREEVDFWHKELTERGVVCTKSPSYLSQFHIYNATFQDPMSYTLEIQTFDVNYAPH